MQQIKGNLQLVILKILEQEGKMYGYELAQKVKILSGDAIKITEGALYPSLHKLEAEGLLTVEVLTIDNRLRKYYSITPQGNLVAQSKWQELQDFVSSLQTFLYPQTV